MNRLLTFQDDGLSAQVWALRILGLANSYHRKRILILTDSDADSLVGTGDDCRTLEEWGLTVHPNIKISTISGLELATIIKLIQDTDADEVYWNFPIEDISGISDEHLMQLGSIDVRQTFVYMHERFSFVSEHCKLRKLLEPLRISVHEGYMLDVDNLYFKWHSDPRNAFNEDKECWTVCRKDSFYLVPRDFLLTRDEEWNDSKHSVDYLAEMRNCMLQSKIENTETSYLKRLMMKTLSVFK